MILNEIVGWEVITKLFYSIDSTILYGNEHKIVSIL
jgi:hypothetical protein